MRVYETTFIINPQTDDTSIDRDVQSVSELITKNGGKILHEDRIGTRRLAYQIKGLGQGYYTSLIYEAPTQVLPLLDRHFKLGEAYLRHLTILCERDLKALLGPEEVVTADKDKQEKAVAEATPEESSTEAVPEPTTEEAPPPEKQQAEPAEAVEEVKSEASLERKGQDDLEEEDEL